MDGFNKNDQSNMWTTTEKWKQLLYEWINELVFSLRDEKKAGWLFLNLTMVNKWMNDQMEKWTNEWTNEGADGLTECELCKCDYVDAKRIDQWVRQSANTHMDQWMDALMMN